MGDVVSPVNAPICLNQDGQDGKDAQDKSKGNNGKSGGGTALSASVGETPTPHTTRTSIRKTAQAGRLFYPLEEVGILPSPNLPHFIGGGGEKQ